MFAPEAASAYGGPGAGLTAPGGVLALLATIALALSFVRYALTLRLLCQHARFERLHATDPFGRRYMEGLGHIEFGVEPTRHLVEARRKGRADAYDAFTGYQPGRATPGLVLVAGLDTDQKRAHHAVSLYDEGGRTLACLAGALR